MPYGLVDTRPILDTHLPIECMGRVRNGSSEARKVREKPPKLTRSQTQRNVMGA